MHRRSHLNDKISSTDLDLSHVLGEIKNGMTCSLHTLEDALTYAAKTTAVHVGETLLKQNALLLPDVYDYFLNKLKTITKQCKVIIDQDINLIASSSWLRSQLPSLFEYHIAYRCPVKKYGTVLYQYGGDLLHALSVSLGQARHQSHKGLAEREDNSEFDTSLSEVCLTLNSKLHALAGRMIREDAANPHKIEEVDVDKFIDKLDPKLWKAVSLLTQPAFSSRACGANKTSSVRKIRQFFCICILLFVTNHQCSFPLHTLIADAIETCRGSSN